MPTRTFAVAAAGVGAAVLAATGITYASTTESTPASPSVHRAAAPVHRAAAPVQRAAPPVQRAAPAAAPADGAGAGGGGGKDEDRGREGGGRQDGDRQDGGRQGDDRQGEGRGYGHKEEGRISFNEREYSASTEGCITAASGLGSNSFNVFNDSRKTVEVFRGFTCDGGAPVATVGPHGATNGVVTRTVHGGVFGDDGVVGSFRVIGDHDEW
ncbi:hypothetical protein [Streptomyces tropicalis]|uniref:Uncharacterized protein n=1 Tax=Streptomyces tropicalis TaxID=3034234 RepID=A0ABT6AD61_9ACTN|nr:hypothetical protein [Streptomyces tropicalis]MDF3302591.1 hypothetical protein [Streptomyces tropicalis]